MQPDRWTKVNQLFYAALEKPPEEWSDFLQKECAEDLQLRKEVESLLAAHQKGGEFIKNPVDPISFLTDDHETLNTGQRIGSYRIVKEIGRGGMGAVYLATRADELFNKYVAIKLIKRGMDTEDVLRHFSNERRILGNFDHPNIAHLLDGGSTETGLPYFVMEYIEGKPIDEYCDEWSLSISQRLQLFQQVCTAVSYAHRNLVVHRDLKPSNILITLDGVPKLLDFGIAKILQSESAERSTATGILLMTPEYASPEQAQGLPVNTLTDVYSLGVILYELLTGHNPYPLKSRTPIEIARMISETQPLVPSAVIDPKVSKMREGTPERLRRRLRGDLDNIILKAMRKEPAQRYASADQFSEDIQRHLVGLPVIARRITFPHRLSRFVLRNKITVGLAALIFLTLIGGIITTTMQSHRAEKRFHDVRKLAHSLLFDYHDAIKNLPGSTPVRARLVKDALQYLDSLSAEENNDESLQLELATAYERIGDVQGGTMKANLGDTVGSMKSYRKALAILQSLANADSDNTDINYKIAVCSKKIGMLLWETGDVERSLAENRKALNLLQQLVAKNPSDFDLRFELGSVFNRIGSILLDKSDFFGALENHKKELEIYESFSAAERQSEKMRRTFSVTYEHIATVLVSMGDYTKALEYNRKGLELRESLTKDFPLNADYLRLLGVSYYWQGEILVNLGHRQESLDSYKKDVDLIEPLFSKDPHNELYRSDLTYGLNRIGDRFFESNRTEEAIIEYKRAETLIAEDVQADPDNLWKRSSLIGTQGKICKSLAKEGQAGMAKKECSGTLSLMEKTNLEPTNSTDRSAFADTYSDLGDAYSTLATKDSDSNEWKKACDMYLKSFEIWRNLKDQGLLSKDNIGKIDLLSGHIAACKPSA